VFPCFPPFSTWSRRSEPGLLLEQLEPGSVLTKERDHHHPVQSRTSITLPPYLPSLSLLLSTTQAETAAMPLSSAALSRSLQLHGIGGFEPISLSHNGFLYPLPSRSAATSLLLQTTTATTKP
jgi:hypothetical protein